MPEKILREKKIHAIIIRSNESAKGIHFPTSEELSLQLGHMSRDQGYQIKPHEHPDQERKIEKTQEVIFVRKGTVKLELFDGAQKFETKKLDQGDVVLLNGGHGFEMLEDSDIVAVKQGPYMGEKADKKRL